LTPLFFLSTQRGAAYHFIQVKPFFSTATTSSHFSLPLACDSAEKDGVFMPTQTGRDEHAVLPKFLHVTVFFQLHFHGYLINENISYQQISTKHNFYISKNSYYVSEQSLFFYF